MDSRQPIWGSATADRDNVIFGSKAWSSADKDEYFRLEAEYDAAVDARRAAFDKQSELMGRMGRQFGQERMWEHETWPPVERDEYKSLMNEMRKYGDIASSASRRVSDFAVSLDKKYRTARANKKAIAEEAAASGPMDQLALLPPRGPGNVVPGGSIYQEAAASARSSGLGGRRTRRHKRRRHRRARSRRHR
jgi:hypothetical protein